MKLTREELGLIHADMEGATKAVQELLSAASALITPPADSTIVEDPGVLQVATSKIATALNGMATIFVGYQWQGILKSLIERDGDNANSDDLQRILSLSLVKLTVDSETGDNPSPIAAAWKQTIIAATAQAIATVHNEAFADAAQATGDAASRVLCAENGLDYEAFKAGDTDTVRAVLKAAIKGLSPTTPAAPGSLVEHVQHALASDNAANLDDVA